jgi:hypothetical protein
MSLVVLEDQDSQFFAVDPIANPKGEPLHHAASKIAFNNWPALGCLLNLRDLGVKFEEKTIPKPGDLSS